MYKYKRFSPYYSLVIALLVLCIHGLSLWAAPPKSMTISVESGEVQFVSNDGLIKKSIKAGEEITVDSSNIIVNANEQPGESDDQSSTIVTEPETANLILMVRDMSGQPLSNEQVFIQNGDDALQQSLDKDGTLTLNRLNAVNTTVTIANNNTTFGNQLDCNLTSGDNSLEMLVAVKAALQLNVINQDEQSVVGAKVTITPTTDTLRVDGADLEDRSTSENGGALFSPIAAGSYLVSVSAAGYLIHEEAVHVDAELQPATMHLRTKGRIIVYVQNVESEPIFSAKVTLKSKPGTGSIMMISETSDTAGFTTFEDVPPGEYVIYAEHVWYTSGEKSQCEIKLVKDRHEVTLALENREYSVSGRVFEKDSGQPVSDIKVIAYDIETLKNKQVFWNYDKKRYNVPPDAQTTTNSDGSYLFNSLAGGSYVIAIYPHINYITQSPYYYRKDSDIYAEYKRNSISWHEIAPLLYSKIKPEPNPILILENETQVENINLYLEKSWSVSGRVCLSEGQPLQKCEIFIWRDVEHNYAKVYPKNKIDQSLKTDNEGRFKLILDYYVSDNEFYLQSHHPLYGDSGQIEIDPSLGEEIKNIEIIYDPKTLVQGKVVDSSGKPMENIGVYFQPKIKQKEDIWTVTDAEGKYQRAVISGEYNIYTQQKKGYYRGIKKNIIIQPNIPVTNLDFVLEVNNDYFAGVVVDEKENPLSRIPIQGILKSRSKDYDYWAHSWTDENGQFVLNFENSYNAFLEIPQKDDFEKTILSIRAKDDYFAFSQEFTQWAAKDIKIVLKKYNDGYASIAGTVLGNDNNPIKDYTIFLLPSNPRFGDYLVQNVSHPEGAFHFDKIEIADGPFLLSVRTENTAPTLSEGFTLQRDEEKTIVLTHDTQSFSIKGQLIYERTMLDYIDPPYVLFEITMDNFNIHEDRLGINNLNRAFHRTEIDLKDGTFLLEHVPVEGGIIKIKDAGGYGKLLTTIPIAPGQPGEVRDLGVIKIEEPTKEDSN